MQLHSYNYLFHNNVYYNYVLNNYKQLAVVKVVYHYCRQFLALHAVAAANLFTHIKLSREIEVGESDIFPVGTTTHQYHWIHI